MILFKTQAQQRGGNGMRCDQCKGTGKIKIVLPLPMDIICPKCNGTGQIPDGFHKE